MLVLSRKKNEEIVIGDNIVITVINVIGEKVKIGVEAPKNISVHRSEIYDLIRNSKGKNIYLDLLRE